MKLNFTKKKPKIIVGIELIIILIKKILLFIKLKISLLKNSITANKDPACKLISKFKLLLLKLKKFSIMIKCADELIGKNSVIPWIMESMIISII